MFQIMEALVSEKALKDIINEGSYNLVRAFPKTSLPQRQKLHVFEGIDTSFIDKDILKTAQKPSRPVLSQVTQDVLGTATTRKNSETICRRVIFQPSFKYRNFVRQRENAICESFGSLPVLKQQQNEIPLSYNKFVSSYIAKSRYKTDNEICESRSSTRGSSRDSIKKPDFSYNRPTTTTTTITNNSPFTDIAVLNAHINNIQRVMGRSVDQPLLLKRRNNTVVEIRKRGTDVRYSRYNTPSSSNRNYTIDCYRRPKTAVLPALKL